MLDSVRELSDAVDEQAELFPPEINQRRRIDPGSGRALEILRHAIEYLVAESFREGESFSANDPRMQAVRLLMVLNRQVYFECPVALTFPERLRRFVGGLRGWRVSGHRVSAIIQRALADWTRRPDQFGAKEIE
jgi:hypothetical protein